MPEPAEPRSFEIDAAEDTCRRVVEELAAANGCDVLELEPLYYDVDPAVAEKLVGGDDSVSGRISFASNGFEVTVRSDGRVGLDPVD